MKERRKPRNREAPEPESPESPESRLPECCLALSERAMFPDVDVQLCDVISTVELFGSRRAAWPSAELDEPFPALDERDESFSRTPTGERP